MGYIELIPGNRIGDFMIRRSSLLIFITGVLPELCCAQSGLPATPPAANQQSTQTANGQTSTAAGKTEKTKKVWTNEEVSALQGTVSVVGTERAAEGKTKSSGNNASAAPDPRRGKIQRYRAAIAELRKKIDAADQRITQLKNFKADDSSPSGGINPTGRYNMVPLDEQVKQLEAKKKQLEANIEDLENQARKEGIEPGELR
jgi:DNA repair exonuclease SbcCD ATPase subunit